MTDKMSKAADKGLPMKEKSDSLKKGDRLQCEKCGMTVEVVTDCGCKDANQVHFQCCGQEMQEA